MNDVDNPWNAGRNIPLQAFANEADRQRSTAIALKAVLQVVAAWEAGKSEGAALIGVSESTWDQMSTKVWNGVLSQDQLIRASLLISIYKGLHLLFGDELADRWPQLNNRGAVFDGKSPIQTMLEGGVPKMLETHQHIGALCGGL